MLLDRLINEGGAFIGWTETNLGLTYPVAPHIAAVDGNVYRGSRLTDAALMALASAGFRAIVNFCEENNNDQARCDALGILNFHIPVQDNTAPTIAQCDQFLRVVRNPENWPVYGHCEAGEGRTSCFMAVHRVVVSQWAIWQTLDEAIAFGMKMPCQIEFVKNLGRCYTMPPDVRSRQIP